MKRKFAKQYAQSRIEENWELKRIWRNKAISYRRKAIKEYWKQKADDLKAKPSEFYKTFRPCLSDKKQPGSEIHIKANGRIEKDQEKVANVLANYFSKMADDIGGAGVNSFTEDDLSSHSSLTNICNANKSNLKNFCFQPLSSNSVMLALEKLNVRKTCGYDSISPRMFRLASSGIADSLTKLFNECIRKGEWPEAWKKGEWNPVHKKDNRKKHSCETTLLRLTEDWKLAVDSEQFIGVLSTDMSKAFDSLHPSFMINKLTAYGFSEESLSLMRSYFSKRQNRVTLMESPAVGRMLLEDALKGHHLDPYCGTFFKII
ncbi:uncharacterized protein [Montipora foliosa]|uniref:uncharacterized protein n=1 Tax=Montipora foliosa TaxID=591990 RepID=UPI0035F1ED15